MDRRLADLLTAKNLTAGNFAQIMDIQPSSVSHILSGRNKPGYDFIVKLLERFPEINPDWFILGNGPMFRQLPDSSQNRSAQKESVEDNLFSRTALLQERNPEERSDINCNEISTAKKIEQIIIFYTDKTFSIFLEGKQ